MPSGWPVDHADSAPALGFSSQLLALRPDKNVQLPVLLVVLTSLVAPNHMGVWHEGGRTPSPQRLPNTKSASAVLVTPARSATA